MKVMLLNLKYMMKILEKMILLEGKLNSYIRKLKFDDDIISSMRNNSIWSFYFRAQFPVKSLIDKDAVDTVCYLYIHILIFL